jgi:iron complex outermembrane receptor protein
VLRPRFFWEDGAGKSLFVTSGVTVEDRAGGSAAFAEELRTRRVDTGVIGKITSGANLISIRGSAMTQRRRRQFGVATERDRQDTYFGEATLSGVKDAHAWTLGTAIDVEVYRARDVDSFDYTYTVPALFAQDEIKLNSRVTLAASGRADFHNEYGNFFNPRVSGLFRIAEGLTLRLSTGTGVFAPTPFTEETEATGLANLQPLLNLRAEKAWSSSLDLGWKKGSWFEMNATAFGSRIRNAAGLTPTLEIVNAPEPTRTIGSELYARVRKGSFNVVFTHMFVHSTELDLDTGRRRVTPLTPKHTAGMDMMWEKKGKGRIGIEAFYTGRQQLDGNPYRAESIPYWVFGILLERQLGPFRVFLNAEDLADFRQTRYDPLPLPTPRPDGRRTVDAWSPLEGRVFNGGVRLGF